VHSTWFDRRIEFGIVGNIQLGRRTPEPLEIIIAAGLLAKNVHDEAAEVEQGHSAERGPRGVRARAKIL